MKKLITNILLAVAGIALLLAAGFMPELPLLQGDQKLPYPWVVGAVGSLLLVLALKDRLVWLRDFILDTIEKYRGVK